MEIYHQCEIHTLSKCKNVIHIISREPHVEEFRRGKFLILQNVKVCSISPRQRWIVSNFKLSRLNFPHWHIVWGGGNLYWEISSVLLHGGFSNDDFLSFQMISQWNSIPCKFYDRFYLCRSWIKNFHVNWKLSRNNIGFFLYHIREIRIPRWGQSFGIT